MKAKLVTTFSFEETVEMPEGETLPADYARRVAAAYRVDFDMFLDKLDLIVESVEPHNAIITVTEEQA